MSSRSSSRPSLRREESSCSLEGMEKPLRPLPKIERPPRIESIIDWYGCDALSAAPTNTPSPLSFISSVASSSASTRSARSDESRPSRLLKKVSSRRKAGVKVPEQLQIKPRFKRHERHLSESHFKQPRSLDETLERGRSTSPRMFIEDIHLGTRVQTPPASKEPIFMEWRAPVYRPKPQKAETVPMVSSKPTQENLWGADYRVLIGDVSPQSPESEATLLMANASNEPSPLTPVAPLSNHNPVGLMESRISDVLAQPVMPEVFNMDNEAGGFDRSVRKPGESDDECYSKRRPSSVYTEEECAMHTDLEIDAKLRVDKSDHIFKRRTRRKSLQQGVVEAFESLHHWRPTLISAREGASKANATELQSHTSISAMSMTKTGRRTFEQRGRDSNAILPYGSTQDELSDATQRGMRPARTTSGSPSKAERSVGKELLSVLDKGKLKRNQEEERKAELREIIVHVIPDRPTEGTEF